MTKPDDLSQEDWDAVDHAFDEAWDAHGAVFNPASNSISDGLWAKLVEASVRLIMAARLQEREAAANEMKKMRANRQQLELQLGEMTQQEMRTLMAGLHVAEQAIRARK